MLVTGKRRVLTSDQQSQESQIKGQLEMSAVTETSHWNPTEGHRSLNMPSSAKAIPQAQYVASITICHPFGHSHSIVSLAVT